MTSTKSLAPIKKKTKKKVAKKSARKKLDGIDRLKLTRLNQIKERITIDQEARAKSVERWARIRKEVEELAAPLFSKTKVDERYPAPSRSNIFRTRWYDYLSVLTQRKNFNASLLSQLEILCTLHVDERILAAFVEEDGFSYMTWAGRDGAQSKPTPESGKLDRTRAEIARYATKLGIFKAEDVNAPLSGDKDEIEANENWD